MAFDDVDAELEDLFGSIGSKLRTKRLMDRRAAKATPAHCEDCKSGACFKHMKDEDAAALELEDEPAEPSSEAPPNLE